MGDRTTCRLDIVGKLTEEKFHDLLKLLEEEGFESHTDSFDIEKDLKAGDSIYLHDVNYGEMPEYLQKFLQDNQLSSSWSWDHGGEYEAGISISVCSEHIASMPYPDLTLDGPDCVYFQREFSIICGDLALTLEELIAMTRQERNPVDELTAWDKAFVIHNKLEITSSQVSKGD